MTKATPDFDTLSDRERAAPHIAVPGRSPMHYLDDMRAITGHACTFCALPAERTIVLVVARPGVAICLECLTLCLAGAADTDPPDPLRTAAAITLGIANRPTRASRAGLVIGALTHPDPDPSVDPGPGIGLPQRKRQGTNLKAMGGEGRNVRLGRL